VIANVDSKGQTERLARSMTVSLDANGECHIECLERKGIYNTANSTDSEQ